MIFFLLESYTTKTSIKKNVNTEDVGILTAAYSSGIKSVPCLETTMKSNSIIKITKHTAKAQKVLNPICVK